MNAIALEQKKVAALEESIVQQAALLQLLQEAKEVGISEKIKDAVKHQRVKLFEDIKLKYNNFEIVSEETLDRQARLKQAELVDVKRENEKKMKEKLDLEFKTQMEALQVCM